METTNLVLDTRHIIDEVSSLIFGGFLEHMGRAVYEGVYDPDSRHADADDGFRSGCARSPCGTWLHDHALSRRQLRFRLPLAAMAIGPKDARPDGSGPCLAEPGAQPGGD